MEKKKLGIITEARSNFYVLCYAAGFMHLTFLITFAVFRLYLMAVIDVVSVLIYVVMGSHTKRHNVEGHALRWISIFFAEVIIHAVIVTAIQGTEVFFFLYPLMAFPLYGYYLFIYCDRNTFIKAAVSFGMITLFVLMITFVVVENVGTLYLVTGMHELSRSEIIVLRGINVTFTLMMVVAFVLFFYIEVTSLLDKLRSTNEKLNFIATHDALTGLSNRHSLWKYFEELEESGDSYCIVMGDLDDFKKINDTYGHDCGDVVLKSVASIIIENTKDDELACRWGGEEMLIVMRGGHDDCYSRISNIRSMICSLDITSEERPVKVSMTFGFADSSEEEAALAELSVAVSSEGGAVNTKTPHRIAIDSLISMVDKRLYVGKRSGKNTIICTS